VTDAHPNFGQNPTPYVNLIALTTLYLLIRLIGGQPEDATAVLALVSPLLTQIRP
jgi:hypothetical protein